MSKWENDKKRVVQNPESLRCYCKARVSAKPAKGTVKDYGLEMKFYPDIWKQFFVAGDKLVR